MGFGGDVGCFRLCGSYEGFLFIFVVCVGYIVV